MFDVTYTCKKENFVYKLRCALAINRIMQIYDDVELRIKRYDWDAAEELIKEKAKPFSIKDYMKLDLYKGRKILISVNGAHINEMDLAERICRALVYADK